jgi:cytochrome P450
MSEPGVQSAKGAAAGGQPIPRATFFETLRQTLYFRDQTLELVEGLYKRHGPVVILRTVMMPIVSLFGPEANRLLLVDRDEIFSAKRAWDLIMGRVFTNGLLLRDGANHRQHRRIMQPAFHATALRTYVERMAPHIGAVLARWEHDGDPVRAFEAFKHLTRELAGSIFLGVDLGPQVERLNAAFTAAVAASMSVVRLRVPGLEFERGLRGREVMFDYFGSLIAGKRGGDGADMFSRLCRAQSDDGERYSDGEIIDHLIFLMMAAHDTTTSTLTSMVYELAREPAWQERAREECRALTDELGADELGQLTTVHLILRETLRRYPPLSTIPRFSQRAFEFGGHEIPANVMVVVYPIHSHHMAEWWREPYRFDPERFAPGRAEDEQHPYLYIPFGGGAHMCIGYRFAELQIKAVMHQLLRRYRWSVPAGYKMPVQQSPISKPKDGLPIRLERID